MEYRRDTVVGVGNLYLLIPIEGLGDNGTILRDVMINIRDQVTSDPTRRPEVTRVPILRQAESMPKISPCSFQDKITRRFTTSNHIIQRGSAAGHEIKMDSKMQIRHALENLNKKGRIKSLREIQNDDLLVMRCAGEIEE